MELRSFGRGVQVSALGVGCSRVGSISNPVSMREVRATLEAAIDAGGSTLRDYKQADGALGYFQHQFLVYDRAGEPCLRDGCKGIVRRTIQAGRSTFHCPSCQR